MNFETLIQIVSSYLRYGILQIDYNRFNEHSPKLSEYNYHRYRNYLLLYYKKKEDQYTMRFLLESFEHEKIFLYAKSALTPLKHGPVVKTI